MYSKNHRPTKAQKEFWDWVAQQPCVFCGVRPVQIHHIIGAAGKENKIHIGQWLVLPLCPKCHDDWMPNKHDQIHHHFILDILKPYWRQFGEIPMNVNELMAIITWSRS